MLPIGIQLIRLVCPAQRFGKIQKAIGELLLALAAALIAKRCEGNLGGFFHRPVFHQQPYH